MDDLAPLPNCHGNHLAKEESGMTKIILTIIGILLHVVMVIGTSLEPGKAVAIRSRSERFAASRRLPRFTNHPPAAWAAP